MVKSLKKVLAFWGVGLLLFTFATLAISYFLTGYQAKQLNNRRRHQYQQLQQPIGQVPEPNDNAFTAVQPANVSSLLTQAAKQQKVSLHYQQDPQRSEQWLVGVSGTYQNAVRFVASVLQAQQASLRAFPFTQTLKWQDTEQQLGKLSWQFLWLTVDDPASTDHANRLFKTRFPPVSTPPLECLSKPSFESDIRIAEWSLVQLLATQTSPLKKALLKIPGQPLLTLTEHSWVANPIVQLQKVDPGYAQFLHWTKEAGCWSSKPLQLHFKKDIKTQ